MLGRPLASGMIVCLLLLRGAAIARAQPSTFHAQVVLTVVDENGLPVAGAHVTVSEPGGQASQLQTDYAGRCTYSLHRNASYHIRVEKPGFYQAVESQAFEPHTDKHVENVEVVLAHEQVIRQQVNVIASPIGIDPEQTSDKSTMNTPEIVNVPYPTSRDIRNLLPFNPGVVHDASGQVHLAGSETYATLDLLDGFDIRSPVSGDLAMRVSSDAVRSIDIETTRYPVEFGGATGGVVAFYAGMGDNRFRFNVTNFLPSFRDTNGLRFDKFVPRLTFSGPLIRNRAWFFDGLEAEYDNIYIQELPSGANTSHLVRGGNLIKAQVNLTSANSLSGGMLFNDYHSPYEGLSSLTPQESTTKQDSTAWLPYVRDQHSFANGTLLDVGLGAMRFRADIVPHGTIPYELTPETAKGSFFENEVSRSQREQTAATLYMPARYWGGRHDLKTGIEVDRVSFDKEISRSPVQYLREDGTLLRQSVFPAQVPSTRHNLETGAYVQDRWLACKSLLIEPGLRFDWDEIIRRPLFSPRLAVVYSPPGPETRTKLSAGVGLYYEHTQLEYLTRSLAGIRYDTYYAADGITPASEPLRTVFEANDGTLTQTRAINWSVSIERKLPGQIFAGVNFLQKRIDDGLVYSNQGAAEMLSGKYLLTNSRRDHYDSVELNARRTFADGYTLFASYTRSSARTNAALDYVPTLSLLGPQRSGPLPWDTPNRLISWGWLPFLLPKFTKSWDFVYTMTWQSGFPFTTVDENHEVVGAAGSRRFPDYLSFSPGLEWRFHIRGVYFGLRGVLENSTKSGNPAVVNRVIDSPDYGRFSEFQGRAFTARIRLIRSK